MDKESLRKFYFSGGSSYGAFKGSASTTNNNSSSTKQRSGPGSRAESPSVPPAPQSMADLSTSQIDVTVDAASRRAGSPVDQFGSVTAADVSSFAPSNKKNTAGGSPTNSVAPPGGSSVQAVRSIGKANATNIVPADAASAEYFAFLKQQQEVQRTHNRLEETIAEWEQGRRDRQAEITKLRAHCAELLSTIESGKDWKLKSKYDVQQLVRDANMILQPVELVEDKPPQVLAIDQLSSHFGRIQKTYGSSLQCAPYKLTLEQVQRRLFLMKNAYDEGNMDSTSVARIADTLVVQLENICQLHTLETIVKGHEEVIERGTFAVEDMRRQRDDAVADGEVHIAERLCYDILDTLEQTLGEVVAKAEALDSAIAENTIVRNVSAQYHGKTPEELNKIQLKCSKLRDRCASDIKSMFALRAKVEEVEAQTSAKVLKDREVSDKALQENADRLSIVWGKIEALEREAEILERDRHREVIKRLAEKDKDEHRRAEYTRFCNVVDEHLVPLERTVKNMDMMLNSVEAMRELLDNSFATVDEDLATRDRLLRDVKLETHKEHVEVFRAALLELGEIIYRKERMVEETDKKIQQAHVQQELLSETFNPNAKKFGDIKKSLLANRDDLEGDVGELKQRAAAAMSQFAYSEKALADADVQYVHPVTEQEHHTLAMKAKMLEFKAMLLGHTAEHPVMAAIEDLKQQVQHTAVEITSANADTSGNIAKALPMIQAANRSRFRQ